MGDSQQPLTSNLGDSSSVHIEHSNTHESHTNKITWTLKYFGSDSEGRQNTKQIKVLAAKPDRVQSLDSTWQKEITHSQSDMAHGHPHTCTHTYTQKYAYAKGIKIFI